MKTQTLHIVTWKEGKLFVAKFLELELASQGKTKKEAIAALKEAFNLYTENLKGLPLPSIEEVTTQTLQIP